MDYFELFGLPRRLAVDSAALQQRFYELARRYHPDFHQSGTPTEREAAERESARVNAAYRSLRDPIGRVEYLVRLEEGRESKEASASKPATPPALLAEMFELQEALAEAKGTALDDATRAELARRRDALKARQAAEETAIGGWLSQAWDRASDADRPAALGALKMALATRAYLRTVIADLEETLGEQPGDVAHHRY